MRTRLKPKSYSCILIAIFVLSSIIINFRGEHSLVEDSNQVDFYQVSKTGENELKTSTVSGKITVSGNFGWTFLKMTGKCTGSGTSLEPYIIKDLIIDGGGSGNCILIEDSDVHFIIENCTLYNSGEIWGNAGIRFEAFVSNGQVINNTIYDCYNGIFINWESTELNITENNLFNNYDAGIYFINSYNNTISQNIISTNGHGMFLTSSSSNTILGNEVSNNLYFGIITFEGSNNNKVLGNTFNNQGVGVEIVNSSRNIINSNVITNNGVGIRIDKGSLCNEYSSNIFNGNNNDVQDSQAECIIEYPFPIEITITLGIVLICVITVAGLILRRRKSTIEVKRFKKNAKREAKEKALIEKRKELTKLEFVSSEKPKEVLQEEKEDIIPSSEEDLITAKIPEDEIITESQIDTSVLTQVPKTEDETVKEIIEVLKGEIVKCLFCGKELSSDMIFCLRCGQKINK